MLLEKNKSFIQILQLPSENIICKLIKIKMKNDFTDFLFNINALQNYFSIILGIIITVFLIDKLIKNREKRKNLPIKAIAYSLLWERIDNFLDDFLPLEFRNVNFGSINFETYFDSTTFLIKKYEDYELREYMERSYEKEILSINRLKFNKDIYEKNIKHYNDNLNKIAQFNKDLSDIITQYKFVIDYELVILINSNIYKIKKHFQTYKSKIQDIEDFDNVKLYFILPTLIKNSIGIREFLIANNVQKKYRLQTKLLSFFKRILFLKKLN